MAIHRLLIVDPDRAARDALLGAARSLGLRAHEALSVKQVRERLSSSPPDLLLVDAGSAAEGARELEVVRAEHPGLCVLILRSSGTGADPAEGLAPHPEQVERPRCAEELARLLESVEQDVRLRQESEYLRGELCKEASGELVARSPVMADVLRVALRSARTRAAVLITGEAGTGKRRLAQHLHLHSQRRHRPLVRVLCADRPLEELGARLFGSCGEDRNGPSSTPALLELADGGTLLLEEVCDLPLRLQERLHTTLESSELGDPSGARSIPIDLRVIATSRHDLEALVGCGDFHAPLRGLLAPLSIELRPLRERREDVLPLAELFAERAARALHRVPPRFGEGVREALEQWPWPGNAHELEAVVRRAVLLAAAGELRAGDLGLEPAGLLPSRGSQASDTPPEELGRLLANRPIEDIERVAILATLESTGGNKTEAARRLGVTARTLSNKLKLWRSQGLLA